MDTKNLLNFRDVIGSYFRKLIYFDYQVVDRILNVMFVEHPEWLKEISFDQEEIVTLNEIISFLSSYDGNNIVNDFDLFMNTINHKYSSSFYIYFLHLFSQYYTDNIMFNLKFKINIKELFYLTDTEALFNQKKFRLHFRRVSLGGISLDNDVDSSIVKYVEDNLPKEFITDLDKAIGIYYLLCKRLRYDPNFVVYRDIDYTLDYDKVTLDDNKVVCVQFSIIYHKLLKKYGIDSCLVGDVNNHMYVNLRAGTMMLTADGSRYGNFTEDYNLSDLTGTKYDFMIDGLFVNGTFYADVNYVNYNRDRLEKRIKEIYRTMGLRVSLRSRFKRAITKFQELELYNGEVNKDDFDKRINFLNSMYYPVNSEVEDMQMLTKLVVDIFNDIHEERTEQITLYKHVDGETKLCRLLVLYDEEMEPYYYLFVDNKFVQYNVNSLVDWIIDNGWTFKNGTDIDALCIEDEERILKLVS